MALFMLKRERKLPHQKERKSAIKHLYTNFQQNINWELIIVNNIVEEKKEIK